VKTNRELYKNLEQLLEEKAGQPIPSLECYLLNLVQRAVPFAHRDSLKLEEFFCLLRDAFEDSQTLTGIVPSHPVAGFLKWKMQIDQQIEDLREMARSKQLEDKHRYFGISAPSGRHWFNFDACAYIECGVAGSLGGWIEGDNTGRAYVPGQVACLGADGHIASCDPKDLDRPPIQIPEITWEMFSEFAWCGQNYE